MFTYKYIYTYAVYYNGEKKRYRPTIAFGKNHRHGLFCTVVKRRSFSENTIRSIPKQEDCYHTQ